MTKTPPERPMVRLGYEVGTGTPVDIPIAHTFVTGQTQQSGKTTTLRAIVERSGRRAVAFVTKRGETFEGRAIRPYLPRRSQQPISWRLVESLIASTLGQKQMSKERFHILQAVKSAYSLADVRANVARNREKTKSREASEIYELLGEYLDLVLPEMEALDASDVLSLQPGVNVMDVSGASQQLQALVIRAVLERINRQETDILTVLPEAWEFAPRSRSAPAKDETIAMARKGAAPGVRNFLLCDSQDIAGVEPVVRQAASVWILGVQRELNELKRTIAMIPAGVKRPKPDDVATLDLGQFWVCHGHHAIKTYVQPNGMADAVAIAIARRERPIAAWSEGPRPTLRTQPTPTTKQEDTVTTQEAQDLRAENAQLKTENSDLRTRLEALERTVNDQREVDRASPDPTREPRAERAAPVRPAAAPPKTAAPSGNGVGRTFTPDETFDNERLYQAFKARLIAELGEGAVIKLDVSVPQLDVQVKRPLITLDGSTIRGQIARLFADGFFDREQTSQTTISELLRRGAAASVKFNVGNELVALAGMGFLTRETQKSYKAAPGMKVNVIETEA